MEGNITLHRSQITTMATSLSCKLLIVCPPHLPLYPAPPCWPSSSISFSLNILLQLTCDSFTSSSPALFHSHISNITFLSAMLPPMSGNLYYFIFLFPS